MTYLSGPEGLVHIDLGTLIVVAISLVIFLPWAAASRLPQSIEAPNEHTTMS